MSFTETELLFVACVAALAVMVIDLVFYLYRLEGRHTANHAALNKLIN